MSLMIGKAIYLLLLDNEALTLKVGTKIFPLVADVDTTFPFIIYKRGSVVPLTTKGRLLVLESCNLEIVVASSTYNESIDIAQMVKDTILGKYGMCSGVNIQDIQLVSSYEDYTLDTFILSLTFNITINK